MTLPKEDAMDDLLTRPELEAATARLREIADLIDKCGDQGELDSLMAELDDAVAPLRSRHA
ncbi:hypothetical protein ACIGH6_14180 [Brachybacterium paraconglomeratum]|uniref:hypothetical protein n=1 Tax=Brachybacterium paraconglomeratum TaxID=173362 RepID=UPI0037C52223